MKPNSTPCLRNTWKSPKRTNDEVPRDEQRAKGLRLLVLLMVFRWPERRTDPAICPAHFIDLQMHAERRPQAPNGHARSSAIDLRPRAERRAGKRAPDSMGNARLACGQGFLFPGKPRAARIAFPRSAPRVISAAGQIPSAQRARSPRRSFNSPSDRKAGLHPSPMPPLCNDFTPSQSTIRRVGGIIMQM